MFLFLLWDCHHQYFQLQVATNDRCVGAGASCVLDRGAIELCARKVASATGDARKALELCRKAIEVVQREAMRQYQALHSFGKSSFPSCLTT